jgi:hypothetical protein
MTARKDTVVSLMKYRFYSIKYDKLDHVAMPDGAIKRIQASRAAQPMVKF